MKKQSTSRPDHDPFRRDRRGSWNVRDMRHEPDRPDRIHMIRTRSIGLLVDREPEAWAD
jgi:hypothetical protein